MTGRSSAAEAADETNITAQATQNACRTIVSIQSLLATHAGGGTIDRPYPRKLRLGSVQDA